MGIFAFRRAMERKGGEQASPPVPTVALEEDALPPVVAAGKYTCVCGKSFNHHLPYSKHIKTCAKAHHGNLYNT